MAWAATAATPGGPAIDWQRSGRRAGNDGRYRNDSDSGTRHTPGNQRVVRPRPECCKPGCVGAPGAAAPAWTGRSVADTPARNGPTIGEKRVWLRTHLARARRSSWSEPGLEIAHEAINPLLMLGLTDAGQVRIDGGNGRTLVAEVDLDLAQVLALFQKMSCIGMAQRMNVRVLFDSALAQGQSEGALEGAAAHRFGGRGRALAAVPLAWEQPHRVTVSFPECA